MKLQINRTILNREILDSSLGSLKFIHANVTDMWDSLERAFAHHDPSKYAVVTITITFDEGEVF